MNGSGFGNLMRRELERLAEQMDAYPDDDTPWVVAGDTKNSGGTLALHIVGNLQHFVGAVLGDTGYIRDREAEFGERGVPREQIHARIEACKRAIGVLDELSDDALDAPYPGDLPPTMPGLTTRQFLLHLVWHLGWHLGQLDYHRRVVSAEARP